MKRIFLVVALLALLVLTFDLWRFGTSLDERAAHLIESTGSALTGTPVRVSRVNVRLRDGTASVHDLQIDNPAGYRSKLAMQWEVAQVTLDLTSLVDEPYVFTEVEVVAPTMYAVLREDGSLNLDAIRQHIEARTGATASRTEDRESRPDTTLLRIEDFHLHGGKILLDASALGVDARQVDLPEVRIRDLGGAGGATAQEIGRQILSHTFETTARALAKQEIQQLLSERLPEPIRMQAEEALDGLVEEP